jgi:hypothetical protein
MAIKDRFKVGQRVRFRRSHDKATQLTGTIASIPKGNDDVVAIKTDVDGKLVEVSTLETAHAADVELLDPKAAAPADDSTATPAKA